MTNFYGIDCINSYWDEDKECMLVIYKEGEAKCIANFFALCDYMHELFKEAYDKDTDDPVQFELFVKDNKTKAINRLKDIGEWE